MTTVLDASILAEILVLSPIGERVEPKIRDAAGWLHLPHLADIETASVLRGLALGGILSAERAGQALEDLHKFPAKRWPSTVLFDRIWSLRENVTAYDANYIALAERLDAEFITADGKLARALVGVAQCEVTVVT